MPKLWDTTVEEHRRSVHTAILDTTAALLAQHGLAVTMSQIAQRVGIGRATLYKYFPDVETIVLAWHERQVTEHLDELSRVVAATPDPGERLREVLAAYVRLSGAGGHPDPHAGDPPAAHGPEIGRTLHRAEHMTPARRRLHDLVTGVVADAAAAGRARTDVPAAELATYCLHALAAAAALPTAAARDRLLEVTRAGLLAA